MIGWNEEVKSELKSCGTNVHIGHNVIIVNPSKVSLGNNVRIDPFTLITGSLTTGNNVHICSHVVLGSTEGITLGDWTFVGYGSKLFTASEDYSGKYGPVNDFWGHNKVFKGPIEFKKYSGVASDVVVFPGVTLPEGCTIGASSMVRNRPLEEYSVYFGSPLELVKRRDKEAVQRLAAEWCDG